MQLGYIYRIYRIINQKSYIGITNNIKRRIQSHKGLHNKNAVISKAIKKYGWDAFSWEVLERCPIKDIIDREFIWIAALDTYHNGYNGSPGGGGKESGWKNIKMQNHEIREYQNEIIELNKSGFSFNKISKLYDTNAPLIKRIIQDKFPEVIKSYDLWLIFMKDRFIEDFLNYMDLKDLTNKYNRSESFLRKVLVNEGIDIKSIKKINRELWINRYKIIDRYLNGDSVELLAFEFNCSKNVIYNMFKREGIKTLNIKPKTYKKHKI